MSKHISETRTEQPLTMFTMSEYGKMRDSGLGGQGADGTLVSDAAI